MNSRRRGWQLPERQATAEGLFIGRRRFVHAVAAGTVLGVSAPARRALARVGQTFGMSPTTPRWRSSLDRALTEEAAVAACSPYLEYTADRDAERVLAARTPGPCRIEVCGLVARPRTIDLDDLRRLAPAEERLYRHRCVEGWAAAVPWTGISLAALVRAVQPLSGARFVRIGSLPPPETSPHAHAPFPWPYAEGLTLAEATNQLAFLATGIYGHDLPHQHGAPVRLVVPWKYAYKSVKAVARIEFTAAPPATFWNTLSPHEYPFHGTVDPHTPHPRWSQRTEKLLGSGEVRATLPYNGYAEWVAHLYA